MEPKQFNRLMGALVFAFSFVIYFLTMAPTVSYWDCGEFIACSYKLAVPHPPGAPLYLLVGRIFTLLPIFENIARRVNFISTISSAFTILFLYLITVHLIRQFMSRPEGILRYVPYLGAAIGALTYAFTNSFWFNAVEAEVYAPSMLFTSMVVWLVFRWSERSEEVGSERYLLLIAYLLGLAIGVHLLNVLTIPTMLMIIFYKRYRLTVENLIYVGLISVAATLAVYPGIVKGLPEFADWFSTHTPFSSDVGAMLAAILVIASLFAGFVYAVKQQRQLLSLLLLSVLLIIVGYSTYTTIFIRSSLDPNIDENDPETIEAFVSYLNREQYGQTKILDWRSKWLASPRRNQYSGPFDFFLKYQVNYMYIRYFLWNFLGRAANERDVDPLKFFGIPLLLGLFGAYEHFKRDWKRALAIFALFFMTGLAIVLYLNQDDPQPRERDYSYVGSFFAFSIWIGIGAAVLLEMFARAFQKHARVVVPALSALLFIISPLHVLAKNYHEQDRTGNYVAWDYSYNMLISAEQNGVIYTNGDNDTFPLWYLQEVENIRPDVRVVNLSLLNTPWYIKQLKHKDPKVPITLSDRQIEQLVGAIPWPKKRTITLPEFSRETRNRELQEFKQDYPDRVPDAPETISFELGPKFARQYLRVQDYMILNTLTANKFERPLYFAVTCSKDNMLDGLQKYLRMDGLLFKITTLRNWSLGPTQMYNNLIKKFRYRHLNDPSVHLPRGTISLLQNYRTAFLQLATHYLNAGDSLRFREVMQKAFEVMPPEVIPYTHGFLKQYMDGLGFLAGVLPRERLSTEYYTPSDLQAIGELSLQFRNWELARDAFEAVLAVQPDRLQVKGYLVQVYDSLHEYDKAIEMLNAWLEANPQDSGAQKRLEQIQAKKAAQEAAKNAQSRK